MGSRKQQRAQKIKEEKKSKYFAVLRNCPTSPRKMRLVADIVRGEEVNKALDTLKFSSKEASRKMEKLLLSAISNWQNKNEGTRIEDSHLVVKEVFVDQGRTLKRLRPAPQGRAHRIRKRSNHVTMVLDKVEQTEKINTK
ncbi:MAG: 50S ribosomal protein L22 [Bacteroidales bacterium]|jgi:large subunit ribosomal protein L22